jgi:Phage integrase family
LTTNNRTHGLLRMHRARTAERMLAVGHALTDDDLVFCDDAGQPLWGRHVTTRQLKPLLRDAGLPAIRFHDLRHTFATLQLAAGTNPKIVSEVLEHKEVTITLDRYSHALPTLQARAMVRLDSVLGRAPRRRSARSADAVEAGGFGPDKGPDKGPNRPAAGAEEPDPSVDRAQSGEIGTAYRIPGEMSHKTPPRTPSTTVRHMRRMRQDR